MLTFILGEVMLSHSLLGAVRHASLVSPCFCNAHPAPGCARVVLQLIPELRRLGRGRAVSTMWEFVGEKLENVQAPCQTIVETLSLRRRADFWVLGRETSVWGACGVVRA